MISGSMDGKPAFEPLTTSGDDSGAATGGGVGKDQQAPSPPGPPTPVAASAGAVDEHDEGPHSHLKEKKVKKGWCWGTIDEEEDEEEDPLLKPEENEAANGDDEDEELKGHVNTFKSMTGLWDIDPPDSEWAKISKKDHNTDKITPMGSVAFSVQIWPKDKAVVMNVGSARSEPNTNPFLPPPVGRFKFSWNPFVLGSELCGPKLCASLTCCLLCCAFILLMIFCQVIYTRTYVHTYTHTHTLKLEHLLLYIHNRTCTQIHSLTNTLLDHSLTLIHSQHAKI